MPMSAAVAPSISRNPGPPRGPRFESRRHRRHSRASRRSRRTPPPRTRTRAPDRNDAAAPSRPPMPLRSIPGERATRAGPSARRLGQLGHRGNESQNGRRRRSPRPPGGMLPKSMARPQPGLQANSAQPAPPARWKSGSDTSPDGRRLTSVGVDSEIASRWSKPNPNPASAAIAGRWRAAFVEPATATTTLAAFASADGVTISDIPIPRSVAATTAAPASHASLNCSLEPAGTVEEPEAKAEGFGGDAHSVSGVGACTAAGSRHLGCDDSLDVGVGYRPATPFADRFEHRFPGDGAITVTADLRRPRIDTDRGDAGAERTHDHARRHLVAAGNEHDCIEGVRLEHDLDRVRDAPHGRGGRMRIPGSPWRPCQWRE